MSLFLIIVLNYFLVQVYKTSFSVHTFRFISNYFDTQFVVNYFNCVIVKEEYSTSKEAPCNFVM